MSFHYQENELYCEGVPLSRLAKEFGTPLYVYSKAELRKNGEVFSTAARGGALLPCYAVKANTNGTILKEIFSMGFGADIVSVGELERALRSGVNPKKIVFSGVGKKRSEIQRALEVDILSLNVESLEELHQIHQIAEQMRTSAPVSFRVNPNIPVKTHPHIATGLYRTKFGMSEKEVKQALKDLPRLPRVKAVGLSCHLGSQIMTAKPFVDAAKRLVQLAETFKKAGFPLRHLDLGGGLGISYLNEKPIAKENYLESIRKIVEPTGLSLLIEPGRCIVGTAGILLSQVILTKKNPYKNFVIIDAAMNDLIRPALYEAYHPIEPVQKKSGSLVADIVGPVCETGDFIGLKRKLPPVGSGDLLAIRHAGAYGMSMASQYNSRPRAAEVLVDGKDYRVIRKRESLETLWATEIS
jgi:diaminopimelate decarboxylase